MMRQQNTGSRLLERSAKICAPQPGGARISRSVQDLRPSRGVAQVAKPAAEGKRLSHFPLFGQKAGTSPSPKRNQSCKEKLNNIEYLWRGVLRRCAACLVGLNAAWLGWFVRLARAKHPKFRPPSALSQATWRFRNLLHPMRPRPQQPTRQHCRPTFRPIFESPRMLGLRSPRAAKACRSTVAQGRRTPPGCSSGSSRHRTPSYSMITA